MKSVKTNFKNLKKAGQDIVNQINKHMKTQTKELEKITGMKFDTNTAYLREWEPGEYVIDLEEFNFEAALKFLGDGSNSEYGNMMDIYFDDSSSVFLEPYDAYTLTIHKKE